jgi:hypothetical protein
MKSVVVLSSCLLSVLNDIYNNHLRCAVLLYLPSEIKEKQCFGEPLAKPGAAPKMTGKLMLLEWVVT